MLNVDSVHRLRVGLVLMALAAPLACSCGGVAHTGASGVSEPPASEGNPNHNPGPEDWANPLGGDSEASVADAQKAVPYFTVFQPAVASDASGIFVTVASDRDLAAVVFTYPKSTYGEMYVEEATPELSADQWNEMTNTLIQSVGTKGVYGTAQYVDIRDGIKALATTSEDGTRSDLRWHENGYQMTVRGPSLTVSQCMEIADSIGTIPTGGDQRS